MNKNKRYKRKRKPTESLETVSNQTICESIMFLVNELASRGVRIYDFDNKDKYIQDIMCLDKTYFLAAKEDT